MIEKTKQTAGASSGIGAVYADRLARRGYDLVLVARNEGRLRKVAAAAEAMGRSVRIELADLDDSGNLARMERLLRDDASITTLINNAGFGSSAKLVDADVDQMQKMINANVIARLTYAAAPRMVANGGGTIINNASIVAIAPEMLNGVYGASKAFVLALTRSLHHELGEKGLRVQAVLPGATATEFWEIAGLGSAANLPKGMVMTTEDLVDAALVGLNRGELITIPSLQDGSRWTAYEEARKAMIPVLSTDHPASRYDEPRLGRALGPRRRPPERGDEEECGQRNVQLSVRALRSRSSAFATSIGRRVNRKPLFQCSIIRSKPQAARPAICAGARRYER